MGHIRALGADAPPDRDRQCRRRDRIAFAIGSQARRHEASVTPKRERRPLPTRAATIGKTQRELANSRAEPGRDRLPLGREARLHGAKSPRVLTAPISDASYLTPPPLPLLPPL
jgi:hypothetical protein